MFGKPSLEDLAKQWMLRRNLKLHRDELEFVANIQRGERSIGFELQAQLIRFLCGSPLTHSLIDPCGIVLEDSVILGESIPDYDDSLFLSSLKIPFPLVFLRCTLPAWLLLRGAEIPFLDLEGGTVGSIAADILKVRGDLYLRNGFAASGVNFAGATVGGDFDCSGANLSPGVSTTDDPLVQGVSLNAEGIHVLGDLRMTDFPSGEAGGEARHFQATGTVRLDGLHVEGDVVCDGGHFKNCCGDTLTLRHATVGGDVLMGGKFPSEGGAVRLPGATIGGRLDCARGHFDNEWDPCKPQSGMALELDGTEIKLDLNLSRDKVEMPYDEDHWHAFEAKGTVSLVGTRIGRNLYCGRGYFLNHDDPGAVSDHPWKPALDLRNAQVAFLYFPKLFLDENGETDAKKDDVHIKEGHLRLDGFVYGRISRKPKEWSTYLCWINKQFPEGSLEFVPQPYLQLAKVLKEEGDLKGAKCILVEMERRRARHQEASQRARKRNWFKRKMLKLWNLTKELTVGYGYYPWRAFIGILILCLVGSVIFHCGKRNMTPTHPDHYSKDTYVTFNPLLYSVENSLPLVKLGQSDNWQPRPRPEFPEVDGMKWPFCTGLLGEFRAFQIALGWFLTTMGVAGLAGIVRKD